MRLLSKLLAPLLLAAIQTFTTSAFAFPDRPVRIVAAFGGGGEATLRLIADKMAAELGQPVVVEPQPAAAGVVAAQNVKRAAPDGYTILAGTGNALVIRPLLTKTLQYAPLTDFTAISGLTEPTLLLAVRQGLQVTSVRELVELARKNPGGVTIGTGGNLNVSHLSILQLQKLAGVEFNFIPFTNDAHAKTEMLAGRLDAMVAVAATLNPPEERFRVIANFNAGRRTGLEQVPSVGEQMPGYKALPSWNGFFAPAGTPPQVVARLNRAIVAALADPGIRQRLLTNGSVAVPTSPQVAATNHQEAMEQMGKLIRELGIKAD